MRRPRRRILSSRSQPNIDGGPTARMLGEVFSNPVMAIWVVLGLVTVFTVAQCV